VNDTPSYRLDGKIALVNGGSRGIGAATSRALAIRGAHVLISSRRLESSQRAADELVGLGGRAEPCACHAADLDQIESMFERIREQHGRLDILINNAATNPYFGPIADTGREAFEKTVNVNLRGYFYSTTSAIRLMKKAGRGAIVNVGSISGVAPMVNQGIYSVTKGAIIAMTRAFAIETAALGIRVNAVLPGYTITRFSSALTDDPALSEQALTRIPMKRFAQPGEIAESIVFLASDAASYTTGACLTADGGYLAG
jgi:NAD(P)-dependent dehydrogenase (short-subunit alcohol dehydrogenase family)